jgi:hypothetical protein
MDIIIVGDDGETITPYVWDHGMLLRG